MEKEKSINIGQNTDVEPAALHQIPLGIFAVVKDENGEEREVDLRDIVGSRRREEEKKKINNIL